MWFKWHAYLSLICVVLPIYIQHFFIYLQVQSDEFVSSAPMVSSMLDPRHKHLGFLTSTQKRRLMGLGLMGLGLMGLVLMGLGLMGPAVEISRAAIPEAGGDEVPANPCLTRMRGTQTLESWPLSPRSLLWHNSFRSTIPRNASLASKQKFRTFCGLHPYWLVESERNKVPKFPRLPS